MLQAEANRLKAGGFNQFVESKSMIENAKTIACVCPGTGDQDRDAVVAGPKNSPWVRDINSSERALSHKPRSW